VLLISLAAGLGIVLPVAQGALASTHSADIAGPATGPIMSGYRKTVCIAGAGDSSANATKVVMSTCNGSAEQNWTVGTDGTLQINGKCMDVKRYGKVNKTPVALWTCHGGANQKWQAENGTLVNPYSRKCLDDPRFNVADGVPLEIYTCNGGANQQWVLPAPMSSAKR
jgi:Ricin-type beta-trefoil lectin domain